MHITHITARQILDSRGNPTVEAEVVCADGVMGRAATPSGASTGVHEAHELRDGGDAFGGLGVERAVDNVCTQIKEALVGIPADDQYRIDEVMLELDGTENKSNLGANAILAVSLAAAHAAANVRGIPLFAHIHDVAQGPGMSLPMPMMNVLNGGKHAVGAADFQEYMLIPQRAQSYREAVKIVVEIFQTLKGELADQEAATTVGDEGGFAPRVSSNTEMLDMLMSASEKAGYQPGEDVVFALDVAASEFFNGGSYQPLTEQRSLTGDEMIEYLATITNKYPVVSIEDGLSEDAWGDWTRLTEKLGHLQLVGDDLLCTNATRLTRAIDEKAANAILIKPNQIGTLTETIRTIALAKERGWNTIISHRSGETEDVTIAHLAVGTGAGQIKTGSISRGERTAKHNELMRIEESTDELLLFHPFKK